MLRLLITFAVLNALLLGLEIPRHAGLGSNWIALEALVLTGFFTLLPQGRWKGHLAGLAGGLLALLTLLALADALARLSLSRSVNLYLDYPLARSVYHLVAGSLSVPGAILVGTLLLLGLALLALLLRWLLAGLGRHRPAVPRTVAAIFILVGIGGTVSFHASATLPNLPRAITPGITLVLDQIRFGQTAHVERQAFQALLARDVEQPASVRLDGLAGVDVILGFIESYGVSALFDERYAPVVGARLDELDRRVSDAGLHMVSGTLNAPIFGGQSWLAHASLLSGLRIRNQMHYEFLLDTERETLVQDFRNTGHRTVAVMPAITLPWPQGRWFGYHEIFEAGDMGYAGPPFNWVTMPDQFTWWFFEDSVRSTDDRPVFAKLALISSHAPWVPILPILEDWTSIGDGAIFGQWDGEGEPPESLWRSHDRVREHFALSIAYALEVAGRYAAAFTDDRTLLILLGDHQPAQIITGLDPDPGVPVHVISGDPTLLEPFRERGFIPGAWPARENMATGMEQFREWLHEAYRKVPAQP
ncbi:sulfatase [Thioalkalivibrio sp.]|uniref:sulfatase n=1 Tax=Thioalkalivibrio sp. TaxID=2093813 RepID=UPI003976685C